MNIIDTLTYITTWYTLHASLSENGTLTLGMIICQTKMVAVLLWNFGTWTALLSLINDNFLAVNDDFSSNAKNRVNGTIPLGVACSLGVARHVCGSKGLETVRTARFSVQLTSVSV